MILGTVVLLHTSSISWDVEFVDVFPKLCSNESTFSTIQACLFGVHKQIKKSANLNQESQQRTKQDQWFGILPEFSTIIQVEIEGRPGKQVQTPRERSVPELRLHIERSHLLSCL